MHVGHPWNIETMLTNTPHIDLTSIDTSTYFGSTFCSHIEEK